MAVSRPTRLEAPRAQLVVSSPCGRTAGAWTTKLRQRRRPRQPFWKLPNEVFHRRVPEAFKMERLHFLERLLRLPAVKSDPIDRNKDPGPIAAQPAMHEDLPSRGLAKQR